MIRRLAALLALALLAACSAPGDPNIVPTTQAGLAAYRADDSATLDKAIAALEAIGGNAKDSNPDTAQSAFAAAARLRALKAAASLHLSAPARLLYAERLCAADSWVDLLPHASAATGCEGAAGIFSAWRFDLLTSAPLTYAAADPAAELAASGYVLPSPHRIANLPPYVAVQIDPMKPR
jgi:hypothetical protein